MVKRYPSVPAFVALIGVVVLAIATLATPASAQPVFTDCLSNGAPITDFNSVVETITVSGVVTASDVFIAVDLTHTFQGDLSIDIQGPNASSTRLHNSAGGGNNDINLIYADVGTANGSDSYTCACLMAPSGPGTLADVLAGGANGDWTLTVTDNLGGDQGALNTWCVDIYEQTPPVPVQDIFCISSPGSGFADVTWTNPTSYDSLNIYIDGVFTISLAGTATAYVTPTFAVPSMITVSVEGVVGTESTPATSCTLTLPEEGATVGPDVTYQDCTSITRFGAVGDIHAYALGSFTCNRGPENLPWGATSPLLAMNAYRMVDGRLEQIGMSWVKNGTGAAAGNGDCGVCNGQGGSVLGAGCRDIYGSGFNGGQGILGPRSAVNAYTGTYPGASGAGGTVIAKRLQIHEEDLVAGPLYFVEGVYVAEMDAANGNAHNNASYKRAALDPIGFDLSPTGAMAEGIPAIQAWRDHGLGVGLVDTSVQISTVDIPGEGRFHVGYKTVEVNPTTWRYEYAIFNLNSHRSGGSFSVPLNGATATNAGFHDVDYHSGDPYDNSDWNVTITPSEITWSSPQTFQQSPNTNALRWGTMYNFWFESSAAPSTQDATLGLFRPGTPDSVTFSVQAPEGTVGDLFIRGDVNGNGMFEGLADALFNLNYGFLGGSAPPCLEAADANGNAAFEALPDTLTILQHAFSGGPPPAIPYPDCNVDPTPGDTLGCITPPACP